MTTKNAGAGSAGCRRWCRVQVQVLLSYDHPRPMGGLLKSVLQVTVNRFGWWKVFAIFSLLKPCQTKLLLPDGEKEIISSLAVGGSRDWSLTDQYCPLQVKKPITWMDLGGMEAMQAVLNMDPWLDKAFTIATLPPPPAPRPHHHACHDHQDSAAWSWLHRSQVKPSTWENSSLSNITQMLTLCNSPGKTWRRIWMGVCRVLVRVLVTGWVISRLLLAWNIGLGILVLVLSFIVQIAAFLTLNSGEHGAGVRPSWRGDHLDHSHLRRGCYCC